MAFRSEKPYLQFAAIEFTAKYGVSTPHEATRDHPDRLREWCAIVYALKKLEEGDTWLDGSDRDRVRRNLIRRMLYENSDADQS